MRLPAVSRLVDHLVRGVRGDDDTRRRARLLAWFVIVLETQVLVFAVAYALVGVTILSFFLAGVGVLLTTTPWVARRISPRVAVDWLMVQVFVVLDTVATFTGGETSAAFYWTAMAPVLATMAGGRRRGLAWSGVLAVNATAVGFAFHRGWLPDGELPGWVGVAMAELGVTMLGVVVLVSALIYEHSRDRVHRDLDRAHRELRRLLDSVGQGFFTAGPDGQPSAQRSAVLERWFGPPAGQAFWAWLAPDDRAWREQVQVSWEATFEGVLPLELLLDQLPKHLRGPGRAYDLAYHPVIGPTGDLEHLAVVVDDVLAQVTADLAEREQHERADLLVHLARDRRGFVLFWDEVGELLARLRAGSPAPLRDLHTLKGVTAHWGLRGLSEQCHDLEQRLLDERRGPTAAEVDALAATWSARSALAGELVVAERRRIDLDPGDLAELEDAIASGADPEELTALVRSWRHERAGVSFGRLAEQARALAERLGKGPLEVTIVDRGVRLDPETWRPVWAAMIHAVRNALDHGVEPVDERVRRGKAPTAHLQLVADRDARGITIELSDDGRGIDWDRVRAKAVAAGLPSTSQLDLQRALLADGFSTRDDVTDLSGRGVGLAALAAAVRTLGGSVSIDARPGQGTRLRLICPRPTAALRRARQTG